MAVAAVVAVSCAEDRLPAPPDYTVSGEPVRLKVPVLIPQMNADTRGDLSENQLNTVESLWIRTYNAQTRLATCDWIKINPLTSDLHNMRSVEIDTQSGYSYIVAVANVSLMGVTSDDITNPQPLGDLLDAADTWDDFLKIAVLAPSNQDNVNAPQTNSLAMAGCYSDAITEGQYAEHVAYNEWQKADFQPYFIPASADKVEFKGGIHLRRLVSHIMFNFTSGDPNMELEVNSYRVMNVPKYSWLYERSDEITAEVNFGDKAASAADAANFYADVPQFGSQFIRHSTSGGKEIQSFDFWQAENKHEGTCTSYPDRGKKTEKDGVTLFTSLTGDTWTRNNEASYVIVDCDVNFKNKITVDADGKIVAGGTEVERSGHATYFIHLGNILGDGPEAKAKDFKCFRNVDYTYNVTVNGVDDIRVDAVADTEEFHNEEGLVVDLDANPINLDAHYAVFNIQLKEEELKENFGFIITTYDNGEQITLSENNPRDVIGNKIVIYADAEKKHPIDSKYYNWIELRPTDGENVLAEYKPRFGPNSDGKTFLLTDMYNVKDEAGNNKLTMPEGCISESSYYTVFVNEYTYEPIYGEEGYGLETGLAPDGRPNWMHYVNQNPRRFYIKVSYRESPDGNSVYARSKYAVEQQSLMTYYSQINVTPDKSAIAVERVNETLGLNMRQSYWGGNSTTNGRWNIAKYLDFTDNNTPINNPSINGSEAGRPRWDKFISLKEPLAFPAVAENRLQGGPKIPGGIKPLRKLKRDNNDNVVAFTDPQPSSDYNIGYLTTCVGRNRDNNGNGLIDPEELRWYVPAINNYVDISLGASALTQPLMDYLDISKLPYVNWNKDGFSDTSGEINNTYYSRYMYVASNVAPDGSNNVLWAVEGTSLSRYAHLYQWAGQRSVVFPWQIRCVRNLGSNLKTVVETDKVTKPFVHAAGKLTMNYFNLAAIRTQLFTGNGTDNPNYMPVHIITSSYNKVYKAFEYAPHDISMANDFNGEFDKVNSTFMDRINQNPCANQPDFPGDGWRVPNQIELTMLLEAGGILKVDSENEKLSKMWLSCTANYFNYKTGEGSTDLTDKLLLVSFADHTSQLAANNFGWDRKYVIRCVRDINP